MAGEAAREAKALKWGDAELCWKAIPVYRYRRVDKGLADHFGRCRASISMRSSVTSFALGCEQLGDHPMSAICLALKAATIPSRFFS